MTLLPAASLAQTARISGVHECRVHSSAVLVRLAVVVLTIVAGSRSAHAQGRHAQPVEIRHAHDISSEPFVDREPRGVPFLDDDTVTGSGARRTLQPGAAALPSDTRSWETIPCVIRDDGIDSFRLEVDTNGPVAAVTLDSVGFRLVPPEALPIQLRDDGSGADRIAGDFNVGSDSLRHVEADPRLLRNGSREPRRIALRAHGHDHGRGARPIEDVLLGRPRSGHPSIGHSRDDGVVAVARDRRLAAPRQHPYE
jgi:hypothetical protein